MDVVTAISQQNVQVAAGQIGQPPGPEGQQFQLTINTQGRLTDPEQFADIIVKVGQRAAPTRHVAGAAVAAVLVAGSGGSRHRQQPARGTPARPGRSASSGCATS